MEKDVLLILREHTLEFRKAAMSFLGSKNIDVAWKYGDLAIAALVSTQEMNVLQNCSYFSHLFDKEINEEDLSKIVPEARQFAKAWNYSLIKRADQAKQPGDAKTTNFHPLPYSEISREYFLEVLHANGFARPLKETNTPEPNNQQTIAEITERLTESFADNTKVYHLARLIYANPDLETLIYELNEETVDELFRSKKKPASKEKPGFAGFSEPCWRLLGEISVGIVFVESSRSGGPAFSDSERVQLFFEVVFGLDFLKWQNVMDRIVFSFDTQYIELDLPRVYEMVWRPAAVEQIRYNGNRYSDDWIGLARYRADMRSAHGSAHAFVIFVTPFNSAYCAYARNRTVVISNKDNYCNIGLSNVSVITAHETCHIFGAADEYDCSDCYTRHGCDQVLNSNCQDCNNRAVPCIMRAGVDPSNRTEICQSTMRQLGWRLPLRISPLPVINFGTCDLGQTYLRILTITNLRNRTIDLQFMGSGGGGPFLWNGFLGSLSPQEAKTFEFKFTPVSRGLFGKTFRIFVTSEPQSKINMSVVGKGGRGGIPPVTT